MPSRIGERITTALQDRRVTKAEVDQLIATAKAERKWTPELKAEVEGLLAQHGDAFDAGAKERLTTFLSSTPTSRDLADPAVLDKHATSITWTPVQPGGALFVDGVSYDDVTQGSIGNCYMVSAFSSLAAANPDTIKNAMKDNGDGTVTVRFFESGRPPKPVEVTVDKDLPASAAWGGQANYGKARDGNEQWVTLLEKAYAQWKGGYEAIGHGGYSSDVFQALTGKPATYTSVTSANAERMFKQIQSSSAAHQPMTAATYGENGGVDYSGTGVHANHAYSVLGATEENGVKYVQLRNPWGSSEAGDDGKDDGIFKLKLEDFAKLYTGMFIGG